MYSNYGNFVICDREDKAKLLCEVREELDQKQQELGRIKAEVCRASLLLITLYLIIHSSACILTEQRIESF